MKSHACAALLAFTFRASGTLWNGSAKSCGEMCWMRSYWIDAEERYYTDEEAVHPYEPEEWKYYDTDSGPVGTYDNNGNCVPAWKNACVYENFCGIKGTVNSRRLGQSCKDLWDTERGRELAGEVGPGKYTCEPNYNMLSNDGTDLRGRLVCTPDEDEQKIRKELGLDFHNPTTGIPLQIKASPQWWIDQNCSQGICYRGY